MTEYNVTIKEITSTTAGQGFTIGQGGVISIEFNPTLATSIKNQLPSGDFYLIKFTDEINSCMSLAVDLRLHSLLRL